MAQMFKSPSFQESRKRKAETVSLDGQQCFDCGACKRAFTTKRALQRHLRETKRHRDLVEPIQCSYSECDQTFVRESNRVRHENEQHGKGKRRCEGCGKHVRPNAEHTATRGTMCPGRSEDSGVEDIAFVAGLATPSQEAHFDAGDQDSCDGKCFTQMLPTPKQTPQSKVTSSRSTPGSSAKSNRNYRPPVACGLCRRDFEFDDMGNLWSHLNEHFERLNNNHWCCKCAIGFAHKEDLTRHQLLAETGDCGFSFTHCAPCGGHHPPPARSRPKQSRRGIDNDRFNFCYRLRIWEQSQLQGFRASTSDAFSSGQWSDALHSCPQAQRSPESEAPWAPRKLLLTMQPAHRPWLESGRFQAAMDAGPILSSENTLFEEGSGQRRQKHETDILPDLRATIGLEHIIRHRLSIPTNSSACLIQTTPTKAPGQRSKLKPTPQIKPAEGTTHKSLQAQRTSKLCRQEWQLHLCRASFAGDLPSVRSLSQVGYGLDVLDSYGYSPLHYAAASGHQHVVKCLIDCGATVDLPSANGLTALHIVAGNGQLDVASLAVGGNLTPNVAGSMIQLLLDEGAKVDGKDPSNRTALQMAMVQSSDDHVVGVLLSSGASIDMTTTLVNAAQHRFRTPSPVYKVESGARDTSYHRSVMA